MRRSSKTSAAKALLIAATLSSVAGAQGIGARIRQRAEEKLHQRIDALTDSATDAALARGEQAVKCLATDKKCIAKVTGAGRQVILADEKGQPLPDQSKAAAQAGIPASAVATTTATTSAAPTTAPGEGVWLNYDFIPGERVIWAEDFTGNEVGDFPRRMRLKEGNLEVVKVQGQTMLRSEKGGTFFVKLPERLPTRFTVELRFHSPMINPVQISTTAETYQRSATIGCYSNKAFVEAHQVGSDSGEPFQTDAPVGFVNCSFTVDNGRGIKGYVDEHRTANAPQDSVVRTDTLFFTLPRSDARDPFLLASVRVAAGGKKLYDVLSANGRVATQGILFDTGSDRIRPESTPTLVEIADMLREHADLKLLIEGHTDNVGDAATNQTLSEKRAAAVKAYLVATHHVDASRLNTQGFGASKPVAPNTTAEGRQNNRRVELVKQ
jgi:outer membrane protein OmpA-like peptidoglycan-associated protein